MASFTIHYVQPWLQIIAFLICFGIALLICGGIAAVIGSAKNHSIRRSFLLGVFLGVIGILIVAVQRKQPPKPQPGA